MNNAQYYNNQNIRRKNVQSYPSYDYNYDFDYNFQQQQQPSQSRRQNTFANMNQQLGRQTLNGGFSNYYGGGYSPGGGYSSGGSGGVGGGYGDYGDYGSPAQAKQTYGSYSGGYDCPGIPIALLLVTLLGIGVLGFILFTKIQGAGRRKRDTAADSWSLLAPELENLDVLLLHGNTDFYILQYFKNWSALFEIS